MARYTASVCRLCRREGMKLFLKGTRCYTKKCSFERRPTPPGQHGVRRRKVGEYGLQLREKQKVRRTYGVLERQFRNYFDRGRFPSRRHRREPAAPARAPARQRRLPDGLRRIAAAGAPARRARPLHRQRARHEHPSYRLKPGDRVAVRETHRAREPFKTAAANRSTNPPDWLSVEPGGLGASIAALPRRDQMPLDLNEQLVVEYYSR